MSDRNYCHYCEGKGYLEIRDCSGEIQREETCSFCGGTGYIEEEDERSLGNGNSCIVGGRDLL